MLRGVVALTLFAPVLVAAAPNEADDLFEQGRALAKAGDYAGACDRFEKSFAVDHAPGTELNMGDCQEHLGHVRQAWQLYTAAADDFDRKGEAARAKFARERADALAAKLAEVVVQVAEPELAGLTITIAGHDAKPATEIHDRVEPGSIVVTALAPGFPLFTATSQAAAGARVVVAVPRFAAAVTVVAPPPAIVDDRHRSRVRLALWLGAGGGATAAASLGFSLVGRNHWSSAADGSHCMHVTGGITCDGTGSTEIHDAQRLADIGTGFAIGAGALVAAAAIVYFTAPSERVVVTPVATGQSAGLQLTARY